MSEDPICPCGPLPHPRPIDNLPGLSSLRVRVGDFASFRRALLLPRDGEVALSQWTPNARGDLGVLLAEGWAYLADVLTFYNERIAETAYLRTAHLPGGVERLVRLLGYRPRPGIGAWGYVAAVVSSKVAITVPQGFAIQSKPAPGKKPQVFEVWAPTKARPGGAVPVDIYQGTPIAGRRSLLLRGTVTSLAEGDQVLLLARFWTAGQTAGYAAATVASVAREKDPRGLTNTRVTFSADLPGAAVLPGLVTRYRLLRPTQRSMLYFNLADPTPNPNGNKVILASPTWELHRGDLVLVHTTLAEVVKYSDTSGLDVNMPLPAMPAMADVRFGYRDVGELLNEPVTSITASTVIALPAAGGLPAWPASTFPVLLEDATSGGTIGLARLIAPLTLPDGTQLAGAIQVPPGFQLPASLIGAVQITFPGQVTLRAPLRAITNLLLVSRGKTVADEVLGSGDAGQAGQSFALKKSPVTYLAAYGPDAPDGYKSTLTLRVDGIAWKEVPSFHGQPADAQVFVTREDEKGITHVTFGDGIHGARLPTGTGNIVATYRQESGAERPAPGTLTNVVKPYPGIQSIRSPAPIFGGDDPDPPARMRLYAPRSVLTFGRAISGDDYEAVAAQAPSVKRAKAHYRWDAEAQRAMVTVFVGDDAGAVAAASAALQGMADPHRPISVQLATPRVIGLDVHLIMDPRHDPERARVRVREALLDPDKGLFGERLPRISQPVYRSQIHEACLRVPGVLAVRPLDFKTGLPALSIVERFSPGEGRFFHLPAESLSIFTEVSPDAC